MNIINDSNEGFNKSILSNTKVLNKILMFSRKHNLFPKHKIFSFAIIYLLITMPILANDFYPFNVKPDTGDEYSVGSSIPIRFDVCLGHDYPAAASEWRVEIKIFKNLAGQVYSEIIQGFTANGPACYPINDAPNFTPTEGGKYTLQIQTIYDQEINIENDILLTEFVVKANKDLELVSILSPQPMAEYFIGVIPTYAVLVRNNGDVKISHSDYSIVFEVNYFDDVVFDFEIKYSNDLPTVDIEPGSEIVFSSRISDVNWDLRIWKSQNFKNLFDIPIDIKFVIRIEDDNLLNNTLEGNTIKFISNPIWPNEVSSTTSFNKTANGLANNDFVEFIVTDKFSDPELYSLIVYDSSGVQIDSTALDLFTVGETVDSFTVYSYEYSGDVLPNHGAMALTYDSLGFTDYFISWGGPITAVEGIWKDSTSNDIGITPTAGNSISLSGHGTDFSSFTWENSTPTPGAFNDSQLVPVEEQPTLANQYKLEQNYPNPFNPTTTIRYSIPVVDAKIASATNVILKLFDVLGREVKTLVNKTQSPGNYEVTLDASDLPSGVYYYQIKAGSFVETRKMSLLK